MSHVLVLFVMAYGISVLHLGTKGCERALPFRAIEGDGRCSPGECSWCDEVRELESEEMATMPYRRRLIERGPYR